MQPFFNRNQVEKITSFAFEAGEIAAEFFKNKNFTTEKKSDHSKVTSADIAVSEFLAEKLKEEFPQIPVICEEGKLREVSGDIFFLIDPIDGTSSFASGSVEFAVNIALVKNKKAVFGLIYAPLFEDGKMIFSDENNRVISRNFSAEDKILNDIFTSKIGVHIITSARTKDHHIEKYIEEFYPNFTQNFSVEKLSSAIKFFRLLEGKANLYLHFRPSMEWDTAAGQALVELMGGKVKKLFFNPENITIGENLSYLKSDFTNQAFVATIE